MGQRGNNLKRSIAVIAFNVITAIVLNVITIQHFFLNKARDVKLTPAAVFDNMTIREAKLTDSNLSLKLNFTVSRSYNQLLQILGTLNSKYKSVVVIYPSLDSSSSDFERVDEEFTYYIEKDTEEYIVSINHKIIGSSILAPLLDREENDNLIKISVFFLNDNNQIMHEFVGISPIY